VVATLAAVLSLGACIAWWNHAIVRAVTDRASLVGLLRSTWIAQIERSGAKGA
jgi:hypothetical protein